MGEADFNLVGSDFDLVRGFLSITEDREVHGKRRSFSTADSTRSRRGFLMVSYGVTRENQASGSAGATLYRANLERVVRKICSHEYSRTQGCMPQA